jgi:hypothetical protein
MEAAGACSQTPAAHAEPVHPLPAAAAVGDEDQAGTDRNRSLMGGRPRAGPQLMSSLKTVILALTQPSLHASLATPSRCTKLATPRPAHSQPLLLRPPPRTTAAATAAIPAGRPPGHQGARRRGPGLVRAPAGRPRQAAGGAARRRGARAAARQGRRLRDRAPKPAAGGRAGAGGAQARAGAGGPTGGAADGQGAGEGGRQGLLCVCVWWWVGGGGVGGVGGWGWGVGGKGLGALHAWHPGCRCWGR